ncbi:MAG: 4-hydroxy-3-polyprenylbenzoate decarboxylase [Gammaproteobacteria bacterium]|jgi:4-hydroxy-3-polyprenylbenzoate decarboxylase
MRLIIGISGSSGVIYGIRLLQVLKEQAQVETHLVMSPTAKMNIPIETDMEVKEVEALADVVHKFNDVAASISSGSFKTDGMIIAPCSMKTLSSIVHSFADNLLARSADVVLKEGRKLVLMPRETPLHIGHCRLLYEAAQMGVLIAPPMPAFYNRPETIDDLINHSVGRVLDLFSLDSGVVKRWAGSKN